MDWAEMSKTWIEMSKQIEATHRPVQEGMFDRCALQKGERVIDIGFGTGDTILEAAAEVGETGHVLGLDIAPPMVDYVADRIAGEGGAPVRLASGDAQVFDFDPGAADVVISKFGMMFFSDTAAAFANIATGMRPGGRMIFAAWGPRSANPFFTVPRQVAMKYVGDAPVAPPDAPGPMRFGDPEPVLAALRDTGWDADVATVDLHLTPPGTPSEFARSLLKIGPAAALVAEREADQATKAAIVDDLTAIYQDMADSEGVKVPAQIHFFSAQRPG